jgi:cytochrome P450
LKPAIFKCTDKVIHDVSAFIPFSFGPAACVGKTLALQEMRATVCTLLTKFQMHFEEGYQVASWENDMCDYFVITKGRLPVVFLPRTR